MTTKPIDIDFYKRMRAEGIAPVLVKEKWLKLLNQDALMGILNTTIRALIWTLLFSKVAKFLGSEIWITSPSGKTTVSLPVYQALRVVRKHDWELTETYPLRKISRWEALGILIHGDRIKERYA